MSSQRDMQPEGDRAPSFRGGRVRLFILLLFFLSGACGLVYEVVWMRMLTLVFGATAFATSTILASFFAGLALGSFHFGRVIDRGRDPLKVYALLELGLGISAFLMPVLLFGLNDVYVSAARHLDLGFYQLSLLRFALSFLVLLIPATLMGGTLPVLIKFFVTRRERLGWDVGHLYATNTFGAVVGTMLAGFVLILVVGVREAAYLAGAANLVIAFAAYSLSLRLARQPAESRALSEDRKPSEETVGQAYSPRVARLALWTVGISGFCALALEVLWTRALVFFLDNSTHAFSTMLTGFLLGIAIGSFLIARFIDTRTRLLAWLGFTQILIGVFAVLAIPILARSSPVIQSMARVSLDSALAWKWTGMRFVTALSVMLVPTILMGTTLPLVTKVYIRNVEWVGTAVGNVYSLNTIAGVLGSVVAGFVLIPVIGVQPSIILIATINVMIGGILVLSESSVRYRTRLIAVVGSATAFGSLGLFYLTAGATPLTSYYESMESAEVLSYEEGIGAAVKVFVNFNGEKLLSINGFPVAGTTPGLQDAQQSLAHLPLLLSPVASPRVNVIGFGTGGTSWGVTLYDVQEVETVELVPGVINAANWFPETNHDVLSNPIFNLMMGDGRNYALISEKEYDVISIDATSPKMAGNGSLYSREFYELNKERLSEDGLLAQWLPLHLLSDEEVRMIGKTFQTVFPHTTLWLSPLRRHGVLIGTKKALEIDVPTLRAKLERETVREELAQLYVRGIIDFLSWFVMGEETLATYVEGARLNTDNHPYLEFTPAMAFFVAGQYQATNLLRMQEVRESVVPLLRNLGESEVEAAVFVDMVENHYEATQHSIRGDVLVKMGIRWEARWEYDEAVRDDPDCAAWLLGMRLY